jgi:uncharacterized protein YecE (DUF72 family)
VVHRNWVTLAWGQGAAGFLLLEEAIHSWVGASPLVGARTLIFVFFNNDPNCCAVDDARRLSEALAAGGLQATRVPSREEIHVPRVSAFRRKV